MRTLRIQQSIDGYTCEERKGFIFKKWIPLITYNESNTIFHYSNLERVLNDLPNYVKKDERFKLEINLIKL